MAIDLNKEILQRRLEFGLERLGRIDEKNHRCMQAARVPLRSVSEKQVVAGTRWRANLYRIDGLGEDPQRISCVWQPTCVVKTAIPTTYLNHFGTLVFTK